VESNQSVSDLSIRNDQIGTIRFPEVYL